MVTGTDGVWLQVQMVSRWYMDIGRDGSRWCMDTCTDGLMLADGTWF